MRWITSLQGFCMNPKCQELGSISSSRIAYLRNERTPNGPHRSAAQDFYFDLLPPYIARLTEMAMVPPWKNGFVDFRLAKNTEFWYRDILDSLKYLLRWKAFGMHMCWAPVRYFDTQQERVNMEMNTCSWW